MQKSLCEFSTKDLALINCGVAIALNFHSLERLNINKYLLKNIII